MVEECTFALQTARGYAYDVQDGHTLGEAACDPVDGGELAYPEGREEDAQRLPYAGIAVCCVRGVELKNISR